MALTKAQATLLTQDMMLRGVIETVVTESPVLKYLPFDEVVGTAVTYNKELAVATAAWYDVGDTWTEGVGTFEQATAALKVVGGDADIDHFLAQTYANPNDLEAAVIETKAKAVGREFSETFWDGDTAGDAKQFDGLAKLLVGTAQEFATGANGAALTLAKLDEAIDAVKPGKPDALFMSRRTRRKLKDLRRTSGSVLETGVNQFGQMVETYDGIPVEVDEWILDTYAKGSSGNVTSRIFCVQFGMGRGVQGYENGGITVEPVGPLETKNARRWRVKWYVTAVLCRLIGASVVTGITNA
jgi:hypothetical protein